MRIRYQWCYLMIGYLLRRGVCRNDKPKEKDIIYQKQVQKGDAVINVLKTKASKMLKKLITC